MSGTWKVVGGFVGGLIVGLAGILVATFLMGKQVESKQAAAYNAGMEAGLELATDQDVGIDISNQLNQGLIGENEQMREQLDDLKIRLQALQSRADLTQDTRDQIAAMINDLE